MRFLRTASTRRLLAVIFGGFAVALAAAAIAVAATSGGPKPKPQKLASAIHGALTAPAVTGITARVSFTNHLIDSSDLQGSDPLLQGATGRLWLSSDQRRLRLELQADNGQDAQAVVDNGSFWVYDPSANTVYEGTLPADTSSPTKAAHHGPPSVAQIQSQLNQLAAHLNISSAIPSDVAGRPTYTVKVSPKHDGGLLGSVQLAWDALHGVPLRFALYASGDSTPVLELKATNVHFGSIPASDFQASPPTHATVVKVSQPAAHPHARSGKPHPAVTGVSAVAKAVHFKLVAPSSLVGVGRQSASLLDWAGSPAALLTYGQNLGGIAVIEQTAKPADKAPPQTGDDHQGLSLPTISINGASGQELDTAIGTVVQFTRGGVSYTVIGSVPPAAAEAAARAL